MSKERRCAAGIRDYLWVFNKHNKPIISIGVLDPLEAIECMKLLMPFAGEFTWTEYRTAANSSWGDGHLNSYYMFTDLCDRPMDFLYPRDRGAIRFRMLVEASHAAP